MTQRPALPRPRPMPLTPAPPPQYGPWLERTILILTDGEEPPDGPTHFHGKRIVKAWQERILTILLRRMELGEPTAEAAIIALRNLWGFDEAATRATLAEWKADWAGQE